MQHKKKLIDLYDKVGGVSANWIEAFKNVTEPFSDERLESIVEDLDNMADWKYDINDVRNIVTFEQLIQNEFETKFERLEQMVDELKSPKQMEKLKLELEEILEAIDCCYITLGANYRNYGDRLYKLTEE